MMVCVGAGPGDLGLLTQRGAELVGTADVVAGFEVVVDLVRPLIRPDARVVTMGYRDQMPKLGEVADAHRCGARCVVVFMGDIHFGGFQFLEQVERACGQAVETVPGISYAQALASRGHVCFDDTTFVTFHRRGNLERFKRHLVRALEDDRNAIVIPRPWDFMPKDVCAYLLTHGVRGDHPVEVWEKLTGRGAQWTGTLGDCTREFSDTSIVLIRTLRLMSSQTDSAG